MLQWRALFLLALLAPSFESPVLPKTPRDEKIINKYRLTGDVVPESYDIFLEPIYVEERILDIEQFNGIVYIIAEVKKATSVIDLHHGNNIDITKVEVTEVTEDGNNEENGNGAGNVLNNKIHQGNANVKSPSGATVKKILDIKEMKHDSPTEIWKITLNDEVEKDVKIRIEIRFTGNFVENSLTGFYYSSFTYNKNEPSALLATQFESTYAREAFPCFDEPWMKAEFTLSIKVIDGLIDAIANTPKQTTEGGGDKDEDENENEMEEDGQGGNGQGENDKGRVDEGGDDEDGDVGEEEDKSIVKFKKTEIMSTYLLAFIVYEVYSFGKLSSNDYFTTYARLESEGQEDFCNDISPNMMRDLEEFTKVYYRPVDSDTALSMNMEKMDQAAIPDFLVGAMENWGLVTYRENALLYDENIHSSAAKKRIAEVIAHEYAHLWFSNYVTTKWWDSTWLNEGFANYLQYYVMHQEFEDWKMLIRFVLDEQMSAFDTDSVTKPNSLTHNVNTPDEINNHFRTISYTKGGSIVRQIRNVLGTEAFQRAIQKYLEDRNFNYAEPKDLFKWFKEENDVERTGLFKEELEAALENWTNEPGYPVITVERGADYTIKVKQDRYFFAEAADAAEAKKYYVYLTWYTDKSSSNADENPAPKAWLTTDQEEKTLKIKSSEAGWDWIIVNQNQAGYYRVDYSKELWSRLTTILKSDEQRKKISAIDRAALINNALSLARGSGNRNIDYLGAFKLMEYLRGEVEFEPWAAARSSLAFVERMLITSKEYKDFIKLIVEEVYDNVKFQDTPEAQKDDNVEITRRVNILTLACAASYSPCLGEARKRLRAFLVEDSTNATAVHPDLQTVVYCYGLKGDDGGELWEQLWVKYTSVRNDMTQRVIIASALGCVNDQEKLKQYLDYSVDESIKVIPFHERNSVFSYVYANPEVGVDAVLDFLDKTENVFDKLKKSYGESNAKSVIVGLGGRLTSKAQTNKLNTILKRYNIDEEYAGATAAAESNMKWIDNYGDSVKRGLRGSASTVALASTLAVLCASILAILR